MALQQPQAGPLKGIVVADFSRVLAGPYATMLLADLGATVIKVEGPNGDDTRGWVPPKRGDVGTYYLSIDRQVVRAHIAALRRHPPAGVVAIRPLDLDHGRAEVREQHRRIRPSEHARKIRDDNAF